MVPAEVLHRFTPAASVKHFVKYIARSNVHFWDPLTNIVAGTEEPVKVGSDSIVLLVNDKMTDRQLNKILTSVSVA